ncbi:MAG TPA: serine/threonine-protein kinase [Longimicrobiales bacterium]
MWLSDGTVAHLRAVADMPDSAGTRYRILEPVGRGGMGVVYRAEDAALDREVALKVLRTPEVQPDLAARMLDEARILARLEHPGIVPVYDAGTLPDGRVYCAMKLVRGRRLDEIVTPDTPLTERLRIFRRVCEPVAFAHAHGVVHRDLKPANIMVGEFGEVLVMDWGVAKQPARADTPHGSPAHTATAGTLHGTRLGTPGWMAPEQERGDVDAMDARTDVYALGRILRFLLDIGRAAPRPLRAICERALSSDPATRYDDAEQLGRDVDRYLAGAAVDAYRERVWERAARLYARHRTAVLLVLSYLLMRILFIAFG